MAAGKHRRGSETVPCLAASPHVLPARRPSSPATAPRYRSPGGSRPAERKQEGGARPSPCRPGAEEAEPARPLPAVVRRRGGAVPRADTRVGPWRSGPAPLGGVSADSPGARCRECRRAGGACSSLRKRRRGNKAFSWGLSGRVTLQSLPGEARGGTRLVHCDSPAATGDPLGPPRGPDPVARARVIPFLPRLPFLSRYGAAQVRGAAGRQSASGL